MPCFIRPIILSQLLRGCANDVPSPGITVPTTIMGTNTSGVWPTSVPVKPDGATPTMVKGREFSRMDAPIAVGWPPYRRIQKP